MPGIHPKSKMISFRLTAEEYAEKLGLCRAGGYRSMSRFALSAVRAFAPAVLAADGSPEVNDLRLRIDELAVELNRLNRLVNGISNHGGL
jgi:hypothetical protein